jgi:hypothetical protein
MIPRALVPLAAVALFAPPAAADVVAASFGVSGGFAASASFSVSGGVAVAAAAPAPVITPAAGAVLVPAPVPVAAPVPVQGRPVVRAVPYHAAPPAPTVVVVPAPYAPPPPTVVVTPVTYAAPVTYVASAPAVAVASGWETDCVCDSACTGCLAEPEDEAIFDLVFLGSYRHTLDQGELGGGLFNLRFLASPMLSVEASGGYLAGGTYAGGNFEEAPMALSLLFYPLGRDSLLYAGVGITAGWVSQWSEAVPDPTFSSFGDERWYVGGRAVVGLELELFDFLLLTAEAEAFARHPIERDDLADEYGFALSTGLGLRF